MIVRSSRALTHVISKQHQLDSPHSQRECFQSFPQVLGLWPAFSTRLGRLLRSAQFEHQYRRMTKRKPMMNLTYKGFHFGETVTPVKLKP